MDIQISKYTKDKAKITIDVSIDKVEHVVKLLMKIDSGTINSEVIHIPKGVLGGKARAKSLTSKQRSEIARQGAKKRWSNAKLKVVQKIENDVKKKKLTKKEIGSLGGKARSKNLSAERKSEIGKLGAKAKDEQMSKSLNGKHLTVNDLYSIKD